MAEQFRNLASTTLSGDIDDSATSINVASAMGFTEGDFRILIDSEIMKVTAVDGTTFTVDRHQEGTEAASHTNNTPIYHVLTAGALDAHDQNDLAAHDAYANRPAAGTPGRLFLPGDGIFIERDNGTTWDKFGPIWPMTPPQASDFPTWVNQGSATITDNKGAIFMQTPYSSSDSHRCRIKDYPTPPFTVEMAIIPCIWANYCSNIGLGLCIRDSVSGKLQCYGLGGSATDMNIKGNNYSSPTTNAGAITGWPTYTHFSESCLTWIKYYDDGSYRVISVSVDGFTWTQLVSRDRTDYLTPDQIGIFVNSACGYSSSYGTADSGMTVLHWRQY